MEDKEINLSDVIVEKYDETTYINKSVIVIKPLKNKKKPNAKIIIITAAIFFIICASLVLFITMQLLIEEPPKSIVYNKYNNLCYTTNEKERQIESMSEQFDYSKITVSYNDLYMYTLKYDNSLYLSTATLGMTNVTKLIDTSVSEYKVSRNGEAVYYLKLNNTLYRCKQNKREEIDSGVTEYYINEAGTRLIYIRDNIVFYYSNGNKESITANAEIVHITNDLSDMFYISNSKLYHYKYGKKSKLIINDVTHIYKLYEDGDAYYLDSNSNLCYSNGKNSTTITSNQGWRIIDICPDKPIICFTDIPKSEVYILNKANKENLEHTKGRNYTFNNSGDSLYYIDSIKENEPGDLMVYNLSSNKSTLFDNNVYMFDFLKDSNKCSYFKLTGNYDTADFYIDKNKIDTNVLIHPDITISNDYSGIISDSKGNVIYLKEMQTPDLENKAYELYFYNGKKSKKVNDIYGEYYYYSSDALLYLSNLNPETKTYDLYLYNGHKNESTLVDNDVLYFISCYRDDFGFVSSNGFMNNSKLGYNIKSHLYDTYRVFFY